MNFKGTGRRTLDKIKNEQTQHKGNRKDQRRSAFRIKYPSVAAPVISELDANIVDISETGIKLAISKKDFENQAAKFENQLNFKITFNDGTTFEVNMNVLRISFAENGKDVHIAGKFTQNIPPQRITHEQRYLLKHFKSFCEKNFEPDFEN